MIAAHMTHIPLPFVRSMAGLSYRGGDYFLGRAKVNPPDELLRQVFPWLEQWILRFRAFAAGNKEGYKGGYLDQADMAGHHFIELLQWLRVVFVQDCAVLQLGKNFCISPLSKYISDIFKLCNCP